ncbi:MAG: carbohydrate kinase [Acidobacteriia bacterium]|nr:carbohydrate kinase [Terriglobia bacterium]
MNLLGYDLGSSSVKATILEASTGKCLATCSHPATEMGIDAPRPGWAEQDPEVWWRHLVSATREALLKSGIKPESIVGLGVAYQMHGLVVVDKRCRVLRPAIIWCDSRAVAIGNRAFEDIGTGFCLGRLLNSPGNFTASKLKWIKDNEPDVYARIWKIMLPGDYAAMKMTGVACTTASGLSEGIFWDFKSNRVSETLMDYFGFAPSLLPDIVPTFGEQGTLRADAAQELGLPAGIPVAYRSGDQPNNAFSLKVLEPGEIAATAGTSGVVYGVTRETRCDPQSRVNMFAHVNHRPEEPRLGVLLCINGTGILYSWLRENMFSGLDYAATNDLAAGVPPGSDGLLILPFGNGAERMLANVETSCTMAGLNFNTHNRGHFARAAQEGIVFAFQYGIDIMKKLEIAPAVIRAGNANMFLSPVFRQSLADLTGAVIELYNTDGSQGAARGAGIGTGTYRSNSEAFAGLDRILVAHPDEGRGRALAASYQKWLSFLGNQLGERQSFCGR